jgi:hypothetical protein
MEGRGGGEAKGVADPKKRNHKLNFPVQIFTFHGLILLSDFRFLWCWQVPSPE